MSPGGRTTGGSAGGRVVGRGAVTSGLAAIAPGFAVADVATTSLFFHGARPTAVAARDVNGDGRPDLVADFDRARLRLHPTAKRARLRGWLANGQLFTAEVALP